MRRYLVVAHQTLGSPELLEAMRDRLAEGPCTFHLLVPEYHGGSGLTWTEGKVRAEAIQHLEEGRLRFIAEGLSRHGRSRRRESRRRGGRGAPPRGPQRLRGSDRVDAPSCDLEVVAARRPEPHRAQHWVGGDPRGGPPSQGLTVAPGRRGVMEPRRPGGRAMFGPGQR